VAEHGNKTAMLTRPGKSEGKAERKL